MADPQKRRRRQWRDYRTAAGGRPVKAFLNELTDEEVAAIVAGMKEVAASGVRSARHLRGDIYEVRADAPTRSLRLLFSAEGRLSDWRRRGAARRKALKQKPRPGP